MTENRETETHRNRKKKLQKRKQQKQGWKNRKRTSSRTWRQWSVCHWQQVPVLLLHAARLHEALRENTHTHTQTYSLTHTRLCIELSGSVEGQLVRLGLMIGSVTQSYTQSRTHKHTHCPLHQSVKTEDYSHTHTHRWREKAILNQTSVCAFVSAVKENRGVFSRVSSPPVTSLCCCLSSTPTSDKFQPIRFLALTRIGVCVSPKKTCAQTTAAHHKVWVEIAGNLQARLQTVCHHAHTRYKNKA